jgi:circadian clock protein KaiB
MSEKKYVFRLYTANQKEKSSRLAEDLAAVLEQYYPGQYTVDVVDVLNNMDDAVQNEIFATPTLIWQEPQPATRIIGDLRNMERVLLKLGVI